MRNMVSVQLDDKNKSNPSKCRLKWKLHMGRKAYHLHQRHNHGYFPLLKTCEVGSFAFDLLWKVLSPVLNIPTELRGPIHPVFKNPAKVSWVLATVSTDIVLRQPGSYKLTDWTNAYEHYLCKSTVLPFTDKHAWFWKVHDHQLAEWTRRGSAHVQSLSKKKQKPDRATASILKIYTTESVEVLTGLCISGSLPLCGCACVH